MLLEGNDFAVTLGANSVTTFLAEYFPVSTEQDAVPQGSFELLPNYPNPFHSSTTIGYAAPRAGEVTLDVFDLLGRRVATLESGLVTAGRHETAFDASGLSPGIYVSRLRAGDTVRTRMMTLTE